MSAGAAFGLFMGIYFTAQYKSIPSGVVSGLFTGSLFGFSTALLSYTADRKLRADGIPTGSADTQQTLQLEVDRSINDLFPICKASLCSVNRCKLKSASQEDRIIHGTIGISWKSFGELVYLSLKSAGENKTVIEIKSKPKIPTTLVDYGKNKENVERIAAFIRKEAGIDRTDFS